MPMILLNVKLKYREVLNVLKFYALNQLICPEKYYHYILNMWFPFWDEESLLSPPLTQNNNEKQKPIILEITDRSRALLKPYTDLVNDAFDRWQGKQQSIWPTRKFGSDKGVCKTTRSNWGRLLSARKFAQFVSESDYETWFQSGLSNLQMSILQDDKICKIIRSLNKGERRVFEIVYICVIDYTHVNAM